MTDGPSGHNATTTAPLTKLLAHNIQHRCYCTEPIRALTDTLRKGGGRNINTHKHSNTENRHSEPNTMLYINTEPPMARRYDNANEYANSVAIWEEADIRYRSPAPTWKTRRQPNKLEPQRHNENHRTALRPTGRLHVSPVRPNSHGPHELL